MGRGVGAKETVPAVRVPRPYEIEVTFANGARRGVDIGSLPWGEVFQPLRDPAHFSRVAVDAEPGTVVRPNGADLAPESPYSGKQSPYGSVVIHAPAEIAAGMSR